MPYPYPYPIRLNPYEQLRMQGVGPGLSSTYGPVGTPEEAASLFASLTKPAIPIPRAQGNTTLGKLMAAPYNVAASIAEGIESPVGLMTLPVLAESAPARAALGAYGTVQGMKQLGTAQDPGQAAEGALGAMAGNWLGGTSMPQWSQERLLQHGLTQIDLLSRAIQRQREGEIPKPKIMTDEEVDAQLNRDLVEHERAGKGFLDPYKIKHTSDEQILKLREKAMNEQMEKEPPPKLTDAQLARLLKLIKPPEEPPPKDE